MRYQYLLAAIAATVAASPISALLPRAAVCVPPPTKANGLTGPFKIQVGTSANPSFAGNYAGRIPKRVNYIVFQYTDPDRALVGNFFLDGNDHLRLVTQGGQTLYAYNQVPPRYIALSPDADVAGKITCSINPTTCELNCTTANGLSTDCLGSTKVSPEWRIGGPSVDDKPACVAFQPVVVSNAVAAPAVQDTSDPIVSIAGVDIGN